MSTAKETKDFPKARRLLTTAEFSKVFSGRKRASDDLLVVYALPNGLERSRLGLSIGSKAGNSVERNCIKRHIREAFRTAGGTLPDGFDIVAVARKGACKLEAGKLQSCFKTLAAEACARWEK